jgi:hypothetical protein
MLHQCLFLLAIKNKHSFVCYVIAIQASQGYRSATSYDKQNPIKCLEHHLKMVALDGYEGYSHMSSLPNSLFEMPSESLETKTVNLG